MNKDFKLKLLHTFFPNKCVSCKKVIYYNELFCDDCIKEITKPMSTERCKTCFSLKARCDCISNPKFYFRNASSFVYEKSVKNALLTLKRIRHEELVNYLAKEMQETINLKYKDTHFDAIIPVPMHKSKLKTRGYNQSLVLANALSKRINVPVFEDALKQIKKAKTQHTLSFKQRKANVKGIYRASHIPIECQRVLLVDDITTSSATLNECAKMLRIEGVTKIYCLTVAKTE